METKIEPSWTFCTKRKLDYKTAIEGNQRLNYKLAIHDKLYTHYGSMC